MTAEEIIGDPGYGRLKARVLLSTGLGYYRDKDRDIAERLGRRLEALGMPDCTSYLELLEAAPAGHREMDSLIAEFTVGETYFFRHREQFDALRRRVIPELLESRRSRRALRIWSAGCATGAEPYSISILLRTEMAEQVAGWDVSVLGTDLNRGFLARAEEARYERWAFRHVPDLVRETCFRREGNTWLLRPEYREGVSFRYHNLVTDPVPPAEGGFDLVLCRNVLIYFDHETMKETAVKFYQAIGEGGWLVVGHAEPNAAVFRAFETVLDGSVTLYRKAARPEPAEMTPPPPLLELPAAPPLPPVPPAPVRAAEPAPGIEEVRQLADRGLWEDAAARCRSLIGSDKLNPAAHLLMGLILEHTGRDREAERAFRSSIYLDRTFAVGWYHLGLLLRKRGASGEARRAFQSVLALLHGVPEEEAVEHADGMTAAELRDVARLHLELLGDE